MSINKPLNSKLLTIVLPTYNEKANLEKSVNRIFAQEKNLPGWRFEIIITDSHSPYGTGELAKKISQQNKKIHYIDVERGIGVGLIKGHLYAIENLKPDILAQMDADGQVEEDVLPRLVDAIDKDGYSLALGSRFVKGGKNDLSFSRRMFTYGSSLVCRILMGPWDIMEFTNSARAFTPGLFKKINLDRLPWQEKSFINQPAFLHEAILAGAKYKEVPLVFKDRAQGYSKNKTVNYTYDVVMYALDAMLHNRGINIPLYRQSRRIKTFIKFALVGFTGTVLDFVFYNLFISQLNIPPATSKVFSAEFAIINNFTWNNLWTFKNRNTNKPLWWKFIIFNFVSFGSVIIGAVVIKVLHTIYGDGETQIFGLPIAYYNVFFLVSIIPILTWNFTMNHFVTWRRKAVPADVIS